MRKMYQLRTTSQEQGRQIYCRYSTCWCEECFAGRYKESLTGAKWKAIDLEKRTTASSSGANQANVTEEEED